MVINEYEIIELRILQLLYSQNCWWTIEEISQTLLISKASVQKYLNFLKNRIKNYLKTDIYIDTKPNKGVYLYCSSSFSPHVIYKDILKECLTYSCLNMFFQHKSVPITQMAHKNYSSVASVRRRYKDLNHHLKNFNIYIEHETLAGDEKQVRWFYANFYWTIFKGTEWPFDHLSRKSLDERLITFLKIFKIKLSVELKEQLMYWLAVNYSRYKKGYRVSSDSEIQTFAEKSPLFPTFLSTLEQLFPQETVRSRAEDIHEVYYLYFLIHTLPTPEKSTDFTQILILEHQHADTSIYKITEEWLHLYEYTFGLLSEKHQDFIKLKLLSIHSFSYLFQIETDFVLSKPQSQKDNKEYPATFLQSIKNMFSTLQHKFPNITRNKKYLIEKYLQLASAITDMHHFAPSVRFFISFSEGNLYEIIAQENLNQKFNKKYKLEFLSSPEKADFYLTDTTQLLRHKDQKIVQVTPDLSERDYEVIEQILFDSMMHTYDSSSS